MDSQDNQGQNQVFKLPTRPQQGYQNPSKPIQLVTNHFETKINSVERVYIYHLQINPKIEQDNRSLRQQILETLRPQIENEIGTFIYSGFTVFSAKKPKFDQIFDLEGKFNDRMYNIQLKLQKIILIEDIYSQDVKKSSIALRFFNILIKNFLRQLKFSEVGRTSKFYDMTNKLEVHGSNINIYSGFETSFNCYEKGIFLKLDISQKVVRTDSVLTFIDTIYSRYQDKNKEEKRNIVKQQLLQKTILANYGTYRYYKIEDIIFDRSCSQFEIEDTEGHSINQTLTSYYKDKYNLTISMDKQPLLLTIANKRSQQKCYLVPEFCMMTGIPEEFNDYQRKQVTDKCKKFASEKMQLFENLSQRMNNELNDEDMNPKQLSKSLGIDIQAKPYKFYAKQLQPPQIIVGDNKKIDENLSSNFQLKCAIYQPQNREIIWAVIHFEEFDIQDFLSYFKNQMEVFKIQLAQPKCFNMGASDRRAIPEIEHLLENKIDSQYDIVVIVLPQLFRSSYCKLKHLCTVQKNIITQVVYESTLKRRGIPNVCNKLLQQMAAKTGAILWISKSSLGIPQKTMIIGANVTKDKKEKGRCVVSFCSSLDETFSQYYSRIAFQQNSSDIIEKIREFIRESVSAFYKYNKFVPETIIFLREGVSNSQLNAFQQLELQNILKGFLELNANYKPKFAAIIVDKRIGQKFYSCENGKITNPPSGTIIDNTIVSCNYDFYLIAQQATQGTCTPTHYRIVYDSTGWSQGQMEDFIFSQCFNYMNWNGSIRVPGVLQYAHKLGQFIGQIVNNETKDQLRTTFYYL